MEFGPKQGGGFEVKSSSLEVRGQVPGIDQATFQKAADRAAKLAADDPDAKARRGDILLDMADAQLAA